MIYGIGNDLVSIARIRGILNNPISQKFTTKLFNTTEQSFAETKSARLAEFVAGRFAAKEAVSKALGCGFGRYLGFHDITILPDEKGRPVCRISEAACMRLNLDHTTIKLHLSITHTVELAAAYAIVELI